MRAPLEMLFSDAVISIPAKRGSAHFTAPPIPHHDLLSRQRVCHGADSDGCAAEREGGRETKERDAPVAALFFFF